MSENNKGVRDNYGREFAVNRRGLLLLDIALALPARASDTVVYCLTDTLHSTVVVTDAQRNVIETITGSGSLPRIRNTK